MTNIRDDLEVSELVTSHTRVVSADLSSTEACLSDSLFFASSAGYISEETGLQGFDKAGLAARQVFDEKVDAVSENGKALLVERIGVNDLLRDTNLSKLALNHVGHLGLDALLRVAVLETGIRDQFNDLLGCLGQLKVIAFHLGLDVEFLSHVCEQADALLIVHVFSEDKQTNWVDLAVEFGA